MESFNKGNYLNSLTLSYITIPKVLDQKTALLEGKIFMNINNPIVLVRQAAAAFK